MKWVRERDNLIAQTMAFCSLSPGRSRSRMRRLNHLPPQTDLNGSNRPLRPRRRRANPPLHEALFAKKLKTG